MDQKIILGRILQKLIDNGCCLSKTGQYFNLLSYNSTSILVDREKGQDTRIPYKKILVAIEAYQQNPDDYDEGPGKTKDYGIIHINSPIWSLLHLLDKEDFN